MKIPARMLDLRSRVQKEVVDYFEHHPVQESRLLLDSTGPSFTRQYIVLNEIGLERLNRFESVHAFSGAVYALFGYLAFSSQRNRVSIDHLCTAAADLVFRDHHHNALPGIRAIGRLAIGKSAFRSTQPVIRSLEYIFGEYVEQPFSAFPSHLRIYLAAAAGGKPLCLSNDDSCHPELIALRTWPIKRIIAMAVNVPRVYGGVQEEAPYFDAVYCAGYRNALKEVTSAGAPTLISTPWRRGYKDNRYFLNCYPKGNPRWAMLADFARLVAGLRNTAWSRDIYTAFRAGRD